jgi:hypothetical protein
VDAERIARNDATFRKANESIAGAARQLVPDDRVPFICECADPDCREIVQLTLAEYEGVRSHPVRFVTASGHEEGEHATVVETGDGYVVVQKKGEAGAVAAELDPRSG